MKKHRRLEARKRVDDTLNQLHEVQTAQAQQALKRHLIVLEKEFFSYSQLSKQKRKSKRMAVS